MHTIQTHKGELIAVSVPMETTELKIDKGVMCFYANDMWWSDNVKADPIIGTCTNGELDFDCEPYVESKEVSSYDENGMVWVEVYRDYTEPESSYVLACDVKRSASDSFLSLLTSQKVEYANMKLVFLKREK